MKIRAEKRLFWYLKDGSELDLDDPHSVDFYVQQVLSHGRASDVKKLMKELKAADFRKSFKRIKRYLPREVSMFWEDGLGDTG